MNLLCFDISSGGVSAALLNSQLEPASTGESQWHLATDAEGAATLPADAVADHLKKAIAALNPDAAAPIDAICIGAFMHNCVLLDETDHPITPVFTWLDRRGETSLDYLRSRLGDRFHKITGCHYHPMFPVFKLAAIRAGEPNLFRKAKRIVSVKSLLVHRLTGMWFEDYGMASAAGLFNVTESDWDSEILDALGVDRSHLPAVASMTEIVGKVTKEAASEFGLRAGVPVILGSGDGFLANIGSECEQPAKIAVSLGTSAVARQMLNRPVLDASLGTFCYLAREQSYLFGCAGSNGGNVLDWGRRIFGALKDVQASEQPPVFIPLLNGERSPDWNPNLTGSWHGLTSRHTSADLARSILEGVIFNLGHFVEIVQRASGEGIEDVVLSGNGFLQPDAAPILAQIVGIPTHRLRIPGLASLRGAGICALRALSQRIPPLDLEAVSPAQDPRILQRYADYRRLREAAARRL